MRRFGLAIALIVGFASLAYAVQQPTRAKTWGNEILTAADLNAEFDQIHTYIEQQLLGSGNALTIPDGDSMIVSGFLVADSVWLRNDDHIYFGLTPDYWMTYGSAGSQFELRGTDVDGAGADGLILSVDDGTDDVDFTGGITTGTANTFTGDLALDGDLDFTGAQDISTTAGNLTITPAGGKVTVTDTVVTTVLSATGDVSGGSFTATGILEADTDGEVRIGHSTDGEARLLSLTQTTAGTTPWVTLNNDVSSGTDSGDMLQLDQNYASHSGNPLSIYNASTANHAFYMNQEGASEDSKWPFYVYSNANHQESALAFFRSDNSSSDHGSQESWVEGAVLITASDGDAAPFKEIHNAISTQTLYKRRFVSGSANLSVHEYYGYAHSTSPDSIVVTSTNFSVFTISLYASYDVGNDGSIIKKTFIHPSGVATTVATEVSSTYGSAASIGTPVVTSSRCAVPISWPSSVVYIELKIISDQGVSAPEWVD